MSRAVSNAQEFYDSFQYVRGPLKWWERRLIGVAVTALDGGNYEAFIGACNAWINLCNMDRSQEHGLHR